MTPAPDYLPVPVDRVTGEVLPTLGEPAPHLPSPYVGHPAPPTLRGWIAGVIIAIVMLAVIVGLSSLPEIVGWFR